MNVFFGITSWFQLHSYLNAGVTAETVREYLRFNHRFLEDYILQDVPQEALERLLIRKAQKNESGQKIRIQHNCDYTD